MSALDNPARRTLTSYVLHLARHGPEHLLDAAQNDLSSEELAELADVIDRRPDRDDVSDSQSRFLNRPMAIRRVSRVS